jgi:mRNA interferase MazF
LTHFPYSDLSQTKLRPAIVLADAGRGDWLLCQVTSKGFGDASAVRLTDDDFSSGSLLRESFARPVKLFTADAGLIVRTIGQLAPVSHRRVVDAIVAVLRA